MINHLKTLLICGAALCFNMSVYGQAVSIDLQNVTVKKAITELKEKTGYSVVFSTEDLDTKKVVNVKATDLKEAVSQIITGQNVTFEVQGKRIIIHRESSQDTNSGQQAPIKGVVRGNDGEPIVGATVIVKGTTIGTITDANGRFELNAAPNSTLVISYLGYQQAETSAKKGDLKITLEEDTELLDDVVVVGYGSVKKSNLTGAVASVKMDKVEKVATTDVSNILMGRVAGLDISQTSASPDGGYSMVIRGQASTGAGNTPLYVIDGFPGGDISTVNPSDIESVEVLKDASSTSIYGARAANGVILVTTKKGKEGKAIVNLKLSGSLQSIENPYDIVDAKEYMQLANSYYYEKWLYSNKIAPYGTVDPSTITSTPTYPFSDADIASAVNTDYWDQMTRTGVINEENLSISGGSEKMHYLLSLGHYNQKGVIENSGKQKFMARFNMDYTFNKYISTGVTASGTRALFDLLQESSNSDNLSIINSIIMFPNYLQPYDADGNYTLNPNHGGNNPLSLNEVTNRRKNTRLLISNYWNFQITPDLLARVSWGWNYGETRRDEYYPKTTFTGMQSNSSATISQTTRNDYLLDATLTYSKTLAKIHAIKVMAGYAYQKYESDYFMAGNSDFLSDISNVYNLGGGGDLTKKVGSSLSISKYVSWFGRINYDLKDRYLFNFTLRADGSDKFGDNHKYGIFPSGAIAWRISEEEWVKDINWISNLKLRLSLGQTGNAEIGGNAYGYYRSGTNAVIGGSLVTGTSESQLSNPNLKWETTTEYNVGLDFGFFHNRITGSFEYFHKVIDDLLDSRSVGSYYPVSSVADNLGSTQSTGVEFQLSTQNIVKKDFTWSTDLTLSHYKDRWKTRNPYTILAVYQGDTDPLHITWGYKTDGLIQAGETVAWDASAVPGSIKVIDLNGDNKIDDNDKTIICNSAPELTLGFGNTFTYKDFDLTLFFYGAFGQERYNYTRQQFLKPDRLNYLDNISTDTRDIWTSSNPNGKYPNGFYTKWESASDFWVEDADFVRLKHLTLGYTLPQGKIRGISRCRLYFDAQNLFCITNYTGTDPETDSFAAYPNQRTFSLGLDITF